jgi:CRP/FNR family transcriptional regulator, anaerobic regulatory protein
MAVDPSLLQQSLPYLPQELLAEFAREGELVTVPKGTVLLRQGQYVKVIPIVMDGLVRVSTLTEDRELLLYFIRPSESCVMSFSAILHNDTSRIQAETGENSTLLLLPSSRIPAWTREHPRLNAIFFQQYNQRYHELIETIQQLLFNRVDHRILHYLDDLAGIRQSDLVRVTHREIAQHLGTAREVGTRTMKRLEAEGKVKQQEGAILLLRPGS